MHSEKIILIEQIQNKIFTIREMQVMIDRDLAELYNVPTKRLNEQVKRNKERFPASFKFQLNNKEKNELVANCDRFQKLKHSSVNPYVFTENGIAMLSAVLYSITAVKISIQIMNAFVDMRKFILTNAVLFQRLNKLDSKQVETDRKFDVLFNALENKKLNPKQGVFYNGQVFDAYVFVGDLIRSAKKSIILIDNYVDDSVLTLLTKRKEKTSLIIYTKTISKQLDLDLLKHNSQYPAIEIREFNYSHDRFLIIDATEIYHFGASLKDLGKKWFAFSKMEVGVIEMLKNLDKA